MVEYFLFYFLYSLSSSSNGANESGLKKHFPILTSSNSFSSQTSRRLLNQLGLTSGTSSLSFHWNADVSSDLYLTLLREYLMFMVPEIISQLADTSLAPPENILTTLLLKSSSPVWSRIDTGSRYSAFFTGILMEFWMNSYGYGLDECGNPFSDPEFVLPSVDFLQALQVVARHYSSVYALSLSTSNSNSAYVDPAYKTLATESFEQVRLSFYRYLRVAISVWPVDGTLNLLVEVWMSLLSPWFLLDPQLALSSQLPIDDASPNFLPSWRPFIAATFYLYQTLYAQFFSFSAAALEGFLLSGECEDLGEAVSRLGALTSSLLEIMNPLLSVSVSLKSLEIDLTKSSSIFSRFQNYSEISTLNEQIRILEPETFKSHSLFSSQVKLSCSKILLALDNLTIGIFRKYRQINFHEQFDGEFEFEDETVENAQEREKLFNFVLESPKLSEGVKSLAKWSLQLRQDFITIFQLNGDDFKLAKEALKYVKSSGKSSNQQLRRRGPQSQLKYKLSVKPAQSALNDPEGIIRSYELGPLVRLLRSLSGLLTDLFRSLVLEQIESKWNVKLPKRIWNFKFNLRPFAAYPNIFFIILVWMILRILTKLFF